MLDCHALVDRGVRSRVAHIERFAATERKVEGLLEVRNILEVLKQLLLAGFRDFLDDLELFLAGEPEYLVQILLVHAVLLLDCL